MRSSDPLTVSYQLITISECIRGEWLRRPESPHKRALLVRDAVRHGWIYVVKFVAAKALRNISEPQLSIAWPQHIQSKTLKLTRFQQISTIVKNWFGTRWSEVQIGLKSAGRKVVEGSVVRQVSEAPELGKNTVGTFVGRPVKNSG